MHELECMDSEKCAPWVYASVMSHLCILDKLKSSLNHLDKGWGAGLHSDVQHSFHAPFQLTK